MQIWSEDTVNHWRSHYDEAASHWGKWADQIAEQQVKINQGLLMAAGLKPGAKLLDLASGAGEPAITASGLVGPEGQVTATDISAPMVADDAGSPGTAWPTCAASKPTWSFALRRQQLRCRDLPLWPDVCARSGARIGRGGARGAPGRAHRLHGLGPRGEQQPGVPRHSLCNEFLGKPLADDDFLVRTRYAEPGIVAGLMAAAGIQQPREQEIVFEPKIKVGVPFWAPLLEMNAAHVWVGLGPVQQKQVHQAVARAYEPFRDGEHYVLKTHIRVISGLRPAVA